MQAREASGVEHDYSPGAAGCDNVAGIEAGDAYVGALLQRVPDCIGRVLDKDDVAVQRSPARP